MSDVEPIEPMKNVIATRNLWIRVDDGPARPVKVILGAPYLKTAPDFYVCEYHIEGIRTRPFYAGGVDAMQALLLALFTIGAELHAQRELWRRKVWWRDENDPNEDLGFPLLDLHKRKGRHEQGRAEPAIKSLIATQDLWTRDRDGPARPLKVLVWAPYLREAPELYACEWHIEGLQEETKTVYGPDPMQTLVMALFTIGAVLEAERKVWDRKIWASNENDPNEDLGFPLEDANKPSTT
jgi:hypothetical protein